MATRILIAYATKHGSTAEIAHAIGAVLRDRGFDVEVGDVVSVDDPAAFHAVVLGSAVYVGQWRKEAARFLERHQDVLRDMPTWVFSSGPTGDGDPDRVLKGWTHPEALDAPLEVVRPRDVTVFKGALQPDELGIIERLVVRGVGAELGDFRDFGAIRAWAQAIADAMATRTEPTRPSNRALGTPDLPSRADR